MTAALAKAPPADPMAGAGPRPELAWIDVSVLSVDHSYQRTLESERSQRIINRIVCGFRWSAFQAVLVTPAERPGHYLVLDGQHRVEAAKHIGIEDVPAVIVHTESVAEQASAFVRANLDRVTVNAFALHHARVVAGDETALDVERVCSAAGFIIPRYPIQASQLKPGQTLALGSIVLMIRALGVPATAATLKAVSAAWRDKPGYLRASLFRALTMIIQGTPIGARAALYEAITAYLRRTLPSQLYARAVKLRYERDLSEYRSLAEVIKEDFRRMERRNA